ncbi:wax ester/triacylglycerol synthase domain-containing protein [Mycolicibacterium vaccae]|uniref:wax ester/triacylglycerol synthase domain-containing protein n=1 Tax=Mycolicibacterium vaccae TaxID=1810 RepID=UPI003CFA0344
MGSDDLLSYTDQLLFLGQRATGQELVMQCVWVYDRAVDLAGVRRFHERYGHGLMGRRIEPSPLWFGRHRWVAAPGPEAELEVAHARPRAELADWVDECAQAPIDPEHGPVWRLAVLPMTDGSSAVSLVISHCVSDGIGALTTIAAAADGAVHHYDYPAPGSRTRWQALRSDLRQTARDLPEVGRTLRTAARMAVARRHEIGASKPPSMDLRPDAGQNVVVPSVTVHVDIAEWDTRAAELGGNNHSLVAGFAAKLAERMGRRRPADGAVTLQLPISDRQPGDTRANAALLAYAAVDPENVTTDLADVRSAIRQAFAEVRNVPDETLQLLPLTPYVPKMAVRRGSDVVFGLADLPVSCSNLGDVPPAVARVDGTEADYVMLRGVDRKVERGFLERRRGLLTVLAGRIAGRVSLVVVAYLPGGSFDRDDLRALVGKTLDEFALTGVMDFAT